MPVVCAMLPPSQVSGGVETRVVGGSREFVSILFTCIRHRGPRDLKSKQVGLLLEGQHPKLRGRAACCGLGFPVLALRVIRA